MRTLVLVLAGDHLERERERERIRQALVTRAESRASWTSFDYYLYDPQLGEGPDLENTWAELVLRMSLAVRRGCSENTSSI